MALHINGWDACYAPRILAVHFRKLKKLNPWFHLSHVLAAHRAIYNSQLVTLDVEVRKLCASMVGPPPEVDWSAAWNGALHLWNERVKHLISNARANTWS